LSNSWTAKTAAFQYGGAAEVSYDNVYTYAAAGMAPIRIIPTAGEIHLRLRQSGRRSLAEQRE